MSLSETIQPERMTGEAPHAVSPQAASKVCCLPLPTRIAFIGNYLPRQCGIATFTTDLCNAVAAQ